MAQKFSLTVDSKLERLGEIADFVELAARESEMNDDQVYDVQMAVDEACANVIEHAYHGRTDGTIARPRSRPDALGLARLLVQQ